MYHNETQRRLP